MEGYVDYRLFTINGKALGSGEPVRVKSGRHFLFRVLNASATKAHRLVLPSHTFRIVALDGNTVPKPASVPVLDLSPDERADAIVEMKSPGVWVFGEVEDAQRAAGRRNRSGVCGRAGKGAVDATAEFPVGLERIW